VGVAQVQCRQRGVRAQRAQGLEHVPGDAVVLAQRVPPRDHENRLGVLAAAFLRHGFVRTHRDYLVNRRHVRRVRWRPQGDDWEVTLDPPVNVVLPVSRSALAALWAAFGEN
jgi:DNA-binding LytR/AlgR family response regulator